MESFYKWNQSVNLYLKWNLSADVIDNHMDNKDMREIYAWKFNPLSKFFSFRIYFSLPKNISQTMYL